MGSDVRGAWKTERTEIYHEHGKDNLNEAKTSNDAIRTIDKSRTVEDAVFTFIRNLREKGQELISNIIKRDHTATMSETKFEVIEATRKSNSGHYKAGLPKDRIYRDAHSDVKDKMQICISSQDVPKNEVNRPQTREGVSRLSSDIPLLDGILKEKDVRMVTFEPELRCNVSNDNNLGDEINEIMKNKLQNKAEKQDHEPDTFDEIHTNEKDVTMVSNEYVEAKNPICSYEDDIPQNAKDIRKTYPRGNKCKDVMQNKVKNKEANDSIINVLEGCMSKPLEDVKEDDANIHIEHVSLKSKGIAIAIKDNSISPIANF